MTDDDSGHDGRLGSTITVEIAGLSLYTHHGVTDAEREIGQRLVLDVSFELSDCDATETDLVENVVDTTRGVVAGIPVVGPVADSLLNILLGPPR